MAYLECPECGEDAIPNDVIGCRGCGAEGKAGLSLRHGQGCEGDSEPQWTEDDEPTQCPHCGIPLRVVVDDERACARTCD